MYPQNNYILTSDGLNLVWQTKSLREGLQSKIPEMTSKWKAFKMVRKALVSYGLATQLGSFWPSPILRYLWQSHELILQSLKSNPLDHFPVPAVRFTGSLDVLNEGPPELSAVEWVYECEENLKFIQSLHDLVQAWPWPWP